MENEKARAFSQGYYYYQYYYSKCLNLLWTNKIMPTEGHENSQTCSQCTVSSTTRLFLM